MPENLGFVPTPGQCSMVERSRCGCFAASIDADAWHVKFRSTDAPRRRAVSAVDHGDGSPPPDWRVGQAAALLPTGHRRASGPAADPSFTLRQGNQLELPRSWRARRAEDGRSSPPTTPDRRHAFGGGAAGRLALCSTASGPPLTFEPAGLDAAAPIGLWGYSGGAQATLSATEQQPGYAPGTRTSWVSPREASPVDPADLRPATSRTSTTASMLSGIPFGALHRHQPSSIQTSSCSAP